MGRRRDEGAQRRGRSYLAPQQPSYCHYSALRLHPRSDQHQAARQAGPLCGAGEEGEDGEEGAAGGDHARKNGGRSDSHSVGEHPPPFCNMLAHNAVRAGPTTFGSHGGTWNLVLFFFF